MKNYIIAYSYETPFLLKSGDHVRIKSIHDLTCKMTSTTIFCYCLGNRSSVKTIDNGTAYIECPRTFGRTMKKLVHWTKSDFLEDSAMKLAQLLLDEPILILQTLKYAKGAKAVLAHGSMTVAPSVLRLSGFEGTVVFDSLANYAQTLYMRAHTDTRLTRILDYLRLGIFLSIYRLQLGSSNKILYPSTFDAENARKMYRLNQKAAIVPNIFLTSYPDLLELEKLREKSRQELKIDEDVIVLVFSAGFRNKANRDALNLLIRLSEVELSKNHRLLLIVTGPWPDYRHKCKLPCIFTGTVDREELRGILAASDIGLAPIFEGSGTQLKVLEYISAGLPVVTTPVSLSGIPHSWLRESRIYLSIDKSHFPTKLAQAILESTVRRRTPASKKLTSVAHEDFSDSIRELAMETISR